MAISLKHSTTATGVDAGNGQIGKAQWNDQHSLLLSTQKVIGRASAGTGAAEEIDCTAAGRALIAGADAAAQRATLGLGTMAEQDASAIAVTGGSISGITPLAIADGGTGASDASSARANLGLDTTANQTYTASGGSPRSVSSKLGDIVSVKDYGAVGDGTTDDTLAIQAAVDALAANSGGTLLFPAGTYKITDTITVNRSINLVGDSIQSTFIHLYVSTAKPAIYFDGTSSIIFGGGVSGMWIWCDKGSVAGDGIKVKGASPAAVTTLAIRDVVVFSARDGVTLEGTSANEVYLCTVDNVKVIGAALDPSGDNSMRYGFYVNGAAYNAIQNCEATNVGNSAYGFRINGIGTMLENITTDGCGWVNASLGSINQWTTETIAATTPAASEALNIIAAVSVNNVVMIDVDNAKCPFGIKLFSYTTLSNYRITSTASVYPAYPIALDAGASGVLTNCNGLRTYRIEQYTPVSTMLNFTFVGCEDFTNLPLPGQPINVKLFGAVGDGTTDDTSAIQQAIAYAESTATPPSAGPGFVTVYFPFGKYKITDALTVTKSISFVGDGHSEFSTGSRISQFGTDKDHFTVVPVSTGCSCSWDSLTMIGGTVGAALTACINITKVGVGCNSVRIENCTFGTPQAFAIKVQAADDVLINGNLFDVAGQFAISLGTTTAADAVTNSAITNNNFFDIGLNCILAYNVDGLVISDNRVYNASFTTDVFLDGLDTTPYQLKNLVLTGNSFKNVNCIAQLEDVEGFTFTGNSGSLLGNGASSARSCISVNGTCTDIVVVGNRLSGEFNTKYFYDDFNASTYYGFSLCSNVFRSTGTTAKALSAFNGIGVISENSYVGFTSPSVGQQYYTTASAITPGTLAAGATYSYTSTVYSARQGDKVTITPADATWPINAGVIVNAYVSATDTVTLKYTNITTGSIVVPAHDFGILVTR